MKARSHIPERRSEIPSRASLSQMLFSHLIWRETEWSKFLKSAICGHLYCAILVDRARERGGELHSHLLKSEEAGFISLGKTNSYICCNGSGHLELDSQKNMIYKYISLG